MNNLSIPSVLFFTSCDLTPEAIIHKVLDQKLPESVKIDDNVTSYSFNIDNKYYSTRINLCAVKNNNDLVANVDGIVIAFNASNPLGLELVETLLPSLTPLEAAIKMLVCKSCHEGDSSGLPKRYVQEWCVQKGFELIELEPAEEIDPEDDYPEATGVERIREALHAHEWSNLVLKGDLLDEAIGLEEGSLREPFSQPLDELTNGDNFSDLFSQLADMKEQVGRLSGAAREDVAEKIVRAFWNAMGGVDDDL